jgi:hypothetical protein
MPFRFGTFEKKGLKVVMTSVFDLLIYNPMFYSEIYPPRFEKFLTCLIQCSTFLQRE